jgi:hypothetical protein
VSYWLGLGAPGRIALRAAILCGVASLGGCDSLSSSSPASVLVPGTDGGGASQPPQNDASAVTGTSCHPGNVETFVPAAYRHPTPPGQGACVAGDGGPDPIEAYYDDCFGSGMTKTACDAFAAANPTCTACIESAETAPAYGPLVLANGFVEANVAGCIELESPSNFACAQAQQALSDCELAACAANCVVVDQASLLAYENCATQADQTGCSAYDTAAMCLSQEVEAGASGNPESICLATTFEEFYFAIVPLFCGEGSTDGGPPVTDAGGAAGDAAFEEDSGSEADARVSSSADAGAGAPLQDAGAPVAAEGGDAK